MPFVKGQPGGPGRRPKAIKFARPIARAEKQIADRLPQLIENLFVLANGGYERVEEEFQPAGLIYIGTGEFAHRAFPDLPADQLVMVKRKASIADKDRQANEYLVNRILGKPVERAEISGADGGPISITPVDYRAGLDSLKPNDASD